ncbi:hypothetical protein ACVWXO_004252 [Bradyrhizobium sp. LM2.7]
MAEHLAGFLPRDMVFAPWVDASPATAGPPPNRQNENKAAATILIAWILPDLSGAPLATKRRVLRRARCPR